MAKHTRAEFLGKGATMAGALGLGHLPATAETLASPRVPRLKAPGVNPDLVVVNARVYTVDDAIPRAEALAVKNGRFIAVGSTDDIRNLAGADTQVIDAEGMTVTPGFIDTHSHPSGVRELTGVDVNLESVAAIKEALRKRAAETPPGYWVTGFKYDDTKLAEGRPITRQDLDEAVPDHPAMVGHRGGHTGVYNSKAFEMAGVTAQTPDPEGGKFYRENGALTGKVAEHARGAFNDVGKHEEITRETRQKGIAHISQLMAAAGLTSVHRTGTGTEGMIAFEDAYRAGEMRFRMYAFPSGGSELFSGLKAAGLRTGFGDEWLRIGAVKYAADGSASERTMSMSTPYIGRPDDYGILTMTQEEIDEAVRDAYEHGFQIGIHANGDVAIEMVLNAYEKYLTPSERPRIEHATLVNPTLLERMKEIGAIPTPFWTYVYYHGEKWAEYGADKVRWMFPHNSYLEYGIPVAGASDYMPGPFEPMMALQSMVTRKDYRGREWGPNQRVSVDEALRIGTINGAYASFEEDIKGSITPDKLADFVVLAEDPHEVDPDRIKDIEVVRTVVGGKTMHEG